MQWWRAALAALSLAAAAGIAGGVGGAGGAEGSAPLERPSPEAIAKVQQTLLAMMGLKRRPRLLTKGKPRVFVPAAMLALYEQLSHPDSDHPLPPPFTQQTPLQHRVANTVRSFTHQESAIDKRFKGHHKFRLAFNVSVPDTEALKAAELVLNRDSVRHPPHGNADNSDYNEKHRVLVYDIVKPGVKGESKPELKLLDSKWVKTARAGSVHLDVTGAVERWMWRPQHNHGLLVHVTTSEGSVPPEERPHVRLRRSTADSSRAWQSRQPVLLAFTDDGRARLKKPEPGLEGPLVRRTRAASRGSKKHNKRTCQRRPLYVDFEEVGWRDWIVAPPGYDAYFCHGECPFPMADHFNSTNHAIVQMLLNSVDPMAVPKACCVPTTLSAISMLYMDEESKVVLKNYNDMAVEGCGCR